MKFNPRGIIKLKPFEEPPEEAERAGRVYQTSLWIGAGIVSSAVLSVLAVGMTLFDSTHYLKVTLVALGISAVTAGLEWNAGLKARAVNQLAVTSFVLLVAACWG